MKNLVPAPWNVYETDPTDRKYLLVFNGYTRNTHRFPKRKVGDPFGSKADEKWTRFLVAEKLMIREDEIEARLEEKLRQLMDGYPGNTANALLLPTYACQLGCVYCYNEDIRADEGKKRLPPEKMAKKLLAYFDDTPAQFWKLRVTGGGEPLMATDYLAEVSGLLQEASYDRGRDYAMTMVSNAQMATKKRIARLMKVGLEMISTTLDPDHDASRPLKNGGPSFDTIMANLLALPPQLKLIVNINISPGKEKAITELLQKMAPLRARIHEVRTSVVMAPLQQGTALLTGARFGMSRLMGKKETDLILWVRKEIDAHGFRRKSAMPRIGCESYMASESFTLNFAGEPTFCGGLDNMPQYKVDPKSAADRERFDLRIASPQWKEFCKKEGGWCPYLLSCWGGCRMISVTQGMDWSVINCEYEMFDRITRDEMRNWCEVG